MKVLTIIPAKLDSTRLPKKNIQKINGKTLVEYSIEYAQQSSYNPDIIVSTESSAETPNNSKPATVFIMDS